MKEKMCPYWYTVEKLKPYGKRLTVWESNPVLHYSEAVGGAIIALKNEAEVEIRLTAAIERYKKKYPGLLSEEEVKQ
ncbi:hypothetical protein [Neisseria chenwenguii]|uniref:hypothetical protein n=1 Tax=Neisseria chenwenguii TaxID=1853278 RepID=UPI000F5162B1|nr:hypothetical protein [Neisseria chenwenguii]ROV54488.1 hypothetical protein EGS38_10995 [Neisseria chenwenguii]